MPITARFSLDPAKVPFAQDINPTAANDTVQVALTIAGELLATDVLAQVVLTAKVNATDQDTAATTVQKIVTAAASPYGQIVPVTATVYQALINLTAADLAKLLATKHVMDVKAFVQRAGTMYERVILTGSMQAVQGVTGLTTLEIFGDAAVTQPGPALAGSGLLTFQGSAAVTEPGPQLAAAGTLTFLGGGAVTQPGAALASAGDNGIFVNYHPGDPITLSRAGSATYHDVNGVVQTAASGVARDGHYLGGVRHLLLEPAATNVVLWSRDLTNAVWTATNCTVAKNQTGADGGANSASSLTATAANATVLQAITLSSSQRVQTAWVKRITGSGTVQMTTDGGTTWTAVTVTGSWARVSIPAQTLANPSVGFRLVTSGDAIAVDYVQNETGPNYTSEIATTNAAVSRVGDTGAGFALAITPQSLSLYADFTWIGQSNTVLEVGPSASANLTLSAGAALGFYRNNFPGGSTNSAVANPAAVGDRFQLRGVLNADGSIAQSYSQNGGAEAPNSNAGTSAMPANLGAAEYINQSDVGGPGAFALRHLIIARGPQTLSTLSGWT